MQVNKTTTYTFTKEEIEQILIAKVAYLTGDRANENCSGKVQWKIIKGDTGIKDPMDYSPHQPTEVTSVVVTI